MVMKGLNIGLRIDCGGRDFAYHFTCPSFCNLILNFVMVNQIANFP